MCCECILNFVIRYICCDGDSKTSEASFENYQQPKRIKTEAFPYPVSPYYTYRIDQQSGKAYKVEVPVYESKNLKNVDKPTI